MISKLLCRRKKNQSDIARLLGVSPAAVTQVKHEKYQLSGAHLEQILLYLHATPEECIEFYSSIISAHRANNSWSVIPGTMRARYFSPISSQSISFSSKKQ